jgi:hypothetical protein
MRHVARAMRRVTPQATSLGGTSVSCRMMLGKSLALPLITRVPLSSSTTTVAPIDPITFAQFAPQQQIQTQVGIANLPAATRDVRLLSPVFNGTLMLVYDRPLMSVCLSVNVALFCQFCTYTYS